MSRHGKSPKRYEGLLVTASFLFSLAYLLWQRYAFESWDFDVYLLNARYWLHEGAYFEILRPPLAPFLLLVYRLFFGWSLAPYAYTIACMVLFLVATLILSKTLGVKHHYLYPLTILNPFFLAYATLEGTELLSLSLVALYISLWAMGRDSGPVGALAFLSRYNNAPLMVLEFARRNPRKILKNLVLAGLMVAPWLLYNQYHYGNPLASPIDNYGLNIYYRSMYYSYPKNPIMLILPFGPLIFLAVPGLYYLATTRHTGTQKKAWLGLALLSLAVFASYWLPPQPVERYLFPLTLVAGALSGVTLQNLEPSRRKQFLALLLVLGIIVTMPLGVLYLPVKAASPLCSDAVVADRMLSIIKEKGIENCSIVSNAWVYLQARRVHAVPHPRFGEAFRKYLEEGYYGVFSVALDDVSYMPFSSNEYTIVYQDHDIIVLAPHARECKPPEPWDLSFIEQLNKNLELAGIGDKYDYCRVAFEKFGLDQECRKLEELIARGIPPE